MDDVAKCAHAVPMTELCNYCASDLPEPEEPEAKTARKKCPRHGLGLVGMFGGDCPKCSELTAKLRSRHAFVGEATIKLLERGLSPGIAVEQAGHTWDLLDAQHHAAIAAAGMQDDPSSYGD